jgi:hypothetical protein
MEPRSHFYREKLKLAAILGRMREKAHALGVPLIEW